MEVAFFLNAIPMTPGSISYFKGKLDDEGNLNRLFYHKIEAILEMVPSTLRALDKIRNKLIPPKATSH